MKRTLLLVAGVMFALAALLLGTAHAGQEVGKPAPAFSVVDAGGKSIALADLKGKVVLVNIWASWCGPCLTELPKLNELAKKLHGRGAVVLAVNIDIKKENADKFLKRLGEVHLMVVYDEKQSVPKAFQTDAMPSSFLVDKAGVVRLINSGYNTGDELKMEKAVLDLLK